MRASCLASEQPRKSERSCSGAATISPF
jgi:hypothetical protein